MIIIKEHKLKKLMIYLNQTGINVEFCIKNVWIFYGNQDL